MVKKPSVNSVSLWKKKFGYLTAETRRARRRAFLIKKYSQLSELLPCGIPGCNSTGRVSLW